MNEITPQELVKIKMFNIEQSAAALSLDLIAEDKNYVEEIKDINETSYLVNSQELTGYVIASFEDPDSLAWQEFKNRHALLSADVKPIFNPNIIAVKKFLEEGLKNSPRIENTTPKYIAKFLEKGTFNKSSMLEAYTDIEKIEVADKSGNTNEDRVNAYVAGTLVAGQILRGVGRPDAAKIVEASGMVVGATHYGSKVLANDMADSRIRENNRRIEQEKGEQQRIREERLSNRSRQYIRDGLTQ